MTTTTENPTATATATAPAGLFIPLTPEALEMVKAYCVLNAEEPAKLAARLLCSLISNDGFRAIDDFDPCP